MGWTVCASLILASALSPSTEEATARGLSYFAFPNFAFGYGSAFADLDNDGDADIVLLGGPGGIPGIYENDGTGNFTDRSLHDGIPGNPSISSVTAADYDADGDLDLLDAAGTGCECVLSCCTGQSCAARLARKRRQRCRAPGGLGIVPSSTARYLSLTIEEKAEFVGRNAR